ncbi:hypothetical protein MN202_14420 [Rheinheimera muenzenbergensis]|uniref:Uncharacterized protein n=1 Tax=Rheinheimera muenzenbergensis TaxID=1193628 RepID=A0ABU8C995_9GAMM
MMRTTLQVSMLFLLNAASAQAAINLIDKAYADYQQSGRLTAFEQITPQLCDADPNVTKQMGCQVALALTTHEKMEYEQTLTTLESALAATKAAHGLELKLLWDQYFNDKAIARVISASAVSEQQRDVTAEDAATKKCLAQVQPELEAHSKSEKTQKMRDAVLESVGSLVSQFSDKKFEGDTKELNKQMYESAEDMKRKLGVAKRDAGINDDEPNEYSDAMVKLSHCAEDYLARGSEQQKANPFLDEQRKFASLNTAKKQQYKKHWLEGRELVLGPEFKFVDEDGKPMSHDNGFRRMREGTMMLSGMYTLAYQHINNLYRYIGGANTVLASGDADGTTAWLVASVDYYSTHFTAENLAGGLNVVEFKKLIDEMQLLPLMQKAGMRQHAMPWMANVMELDNQDKSPSAQADELIKKTGNKNLPANAAAIFAYVVDSKPEQFEKQVAHAVSLANTNSVKLAIEAESMWFKVIHESFVVRPQPNNPNMSIKQMFGPVATAPNLALLADSFSLANQSGVDALVNVVGNAYALYLVASDNTERAPEELKAKVDDIQKSISKNSRKQALVSAQYFEPVLQHKVLQYLPL